MSGKNGHGRTIRAALTSTPPASSSIAAISEVTTSPCSVWTRKPAASTSPAITPPSAILRSSFSLILQRLVEITCFESMKGDPGRLGGFRLGRKRQQSSRIRLHRRQFVSTRVEELEAPAAGETEDRFSD